MTYRKTFVKDYLSVLHAEGQNPFSHWSRNGREGFVRRVWDAELSTLVVDIQAPNISTCSMQTTGQLGVSLPYLTLLVKNMNKYFNFEVMICDDTRMRRRLRFSNFQSRIAVSTFDLAMPLCLGTINPWNIIRFDLARLVSQAFGTVYRETVKLSINANCRLKRIYFSKTLVPEQLLPKEYTVEPKRRTKTQRLQIAQDEVPSPHTPPPSILTGPSLLFHEDLEYEVGEDMGAESSPRSYSEFDILPESFSPGEGELDAEDDSATFIVSPKSPLTKNISTQTMDDILPSPPLSPSEQPAEAAADELSLNFNFSDPNIGVQESMDEILFSYSQ